VTSLPLRRGAIVIEVRSPRRRSEARDVARDEVIVRPIALVTALALSTVANYARPDTSLPSSDSDTAEPSLGTPAGALNVRAFGAAGDGVADDTTALQAAIDSVISRGDPAAVTRRANRAIYLPAGTYRVTSPLRIHSVENFRLHGDGTSSRILAARAAMDSVIDLNGTAYSSFADFSIIGTSRASARRALWVRWTQVARSSTHNTFSRVTVINLSYERAAFEIGDVSTATGQVDTTAWYFCTAAGARESGSGDTNYQSGFLVGTGTFGNNLLHHFYGCNSTHNRWGVNLAASQMLWSGGIVQSNDVDFLTGTTTYCAIKGVRSEDSLRLLETGGPAAFASTISVEDVNWRPEKLHADGYIVRWKYGGSLRLASIQVAAVPGKSPKLLVETTAGATLHLDGYATTVPLSSLIDTRLGADVRTFVSGYTQLDATGRASSPAVATDSIDLFTSGMLRVFAGKVYGVGPGSVGTSGNFVASASESGGITLSDDGTARIEPHGRAGRPLRFTGWSELDLNAKAKLSGLTGYPTFSGHRMEWAPAAPLSDQWSQGDVVWNTRASAGGPPGWICVSGGSPGIWKAMASLAP
jgi:hypothetical protein